MSNKLDLKKMQELELKQHNYLRSLHGVPPLKLNEELNQIAQKYAEKLAKQRALNHSKDSDRYLKGKKGEWVGENLFASFSSSTIIYNSGSMSDSWYSEIKDYNFDTGKSTGVVGHFTQLVWKDSKEVGFGLGFAKGYVVGVANYYPGGNFNMDTTFKEQILKPIQKEEKDTKDLFELEKVRENELATLNKIRNLHQVGDLVLDDQLCEWATKHSQDMKNTGNFGQYDEIEQFKNWASITYVKLLKGFNYKGGDLIRNIYRDLIEGFDFNKNCEKNGYKNNDLLYAKALIFKPFTKVGFGYCIDEGNTIYFSAMFDQFYYTSSSGPLIFGPKK